MADLHCSLWLSCSCMLIHWQETHNSTVQIVTVRVCTCSHGTKRGRVSPGVVLTVAGSAEGRSASCVLQIKLASLISAFPALSWSWADDNSQLPAVFWSYFLSYVLGWSWQVYMDQQIKALQSLVVYEHGVATNNYSMNFRLFCYLGTGLRDRSSSHWLCVPRITTCQKHKSHPLDHVSLPSVSTLQYMYRPHVCCYLSWKEKLYVDSFPSYEKLAQVKCTFTVMWWTVCIRHASDSMGFFVDRVLECR